MRRLLYICSLPHSGSTALSLFLGTHSRLIGLGGIDRAVSVVAEAIASNDATKLPALQCTCGVAATECVFWGEVAKQISTRDFRKRQVRYELALEVFQRVFGDDFWPVDSSKHVEPLEDWRGLPDLDLKVIHLIKDVRAAVTSAIDHARRAKKTRPGPLLVLEHSRRWRRENRKIDQFLARTTLPNQRVGYEEICLMPATMMRVISQFAGVPEEEGSLQLRASQSHLITGNRMREQAEKQELRYDHRWLARRDWIWAAVFSPEIFRYNSKAVYSNKSDALWTR